MEKFPAIVDESFLRIGYGMNVIQFSLLATDNGLTYSISDCKEYILDHTLMTVKPNVYTYRKVYMDEVRLVVLKLNNVLNVLEFVNLFEHKINFPLSIINRFNESEAVIFRGSKKWFMSPPMLSLYALLIRNGTNHILGDSLDKTLDDICKKNLYFNSSYKTIETIMKKGPENIFGEDLNKNWNFTLHDIHFCGIVNFSSGLLRKFMPEWYAALENPDENK
jgi:hypothetical protein